MLNRCCGIPDLRTLKSPPKTRRSPLFANGFPANGLRIIWCRQQSKLLSRNETGDGTTAGGFGQAVLSISCDAVDVSSRFVERRFLRARFDCLRQFAQAG